MNAKMGEPRMLCSPSLKLGIGCEHECMCEWVCVCFGGFGAWFAHTTGKSSTPCISKIYTMLDCQVPLWMVKSFVIHRSVSAHLPTVAWLLFPLIQSNFNRLLQHTVIVDCDYTCSFRCWRYRLPWYRSHQLNVVLTKDRQAGRFDTALYL